MRILSIALAALVVGAGALHATNGMSQIGYGVKAKGMGGVSVALPQDSFVIATNPAGIVELGCRADVELSYTYQTGYYNALNREGSPPSNRVISTMKGNLWWPGLGVVARVNPCISVGIAAFVLGANDTVWEPPLLLLGTPPRAAFPSDVTAMQNYFVSISPSIAWRICSNQSVGISGSIVIATANIRGISQFAFGPLGLFVTNNGADYASGVNLRIGWLGTFFANRLKLGASVVTKTAMSRFTEYQGFYANYGGLQWPWSGTLGFAWTFSPCWMVAIDLRYIQWKSVDAAYFSQYANQAERLAFRGMWDAQGLGWNNQGVAKIGLAWTPSSCWTLRIGYNYNTAFLPASEMLQNGLVNGFIRNHVTAGATLLSCLGELSFYYAHGFRHAVRSHGGLNSRNNSKFANISNEQDEIGLAWGGRF